MNMTSVYDTAVRQLASPSTWCRGARSLARLGDHRALVPLLRAYETPVEESKLCLLEALEALNAVSRARDIFDNGNTEERRLALHLMALFPNDDHLTRLAQALLDLDPMVQQQARRSLASQYQTSLWEALIIELLNAEDNQTRLMAIENLAKRKTQRARDALTVRLSQESDEELRSRLKEVIAAHGT